VLLEIWHRPLQTLAGEHWMNEALETCGARNAFAELPGIAPTISLEQLYARDPVAIVGAGSASGEADFRSRWQERATLAAVRQRHLLYLDPDLIQRPTLRLAEGVARLCAGLDAMR
jgi:iron complex transport system substrate-binding protein